MPARILIVHDKKALQERITSVLTPFHVVTTCGDIPDAMNAIKSLEQTNLSGTLLDLIISAVHVNSVSKLSVFDLLKWAKGNPHVADVPFVLLDTEPSELARYLTDSIREAGHALGAAGYAVIHQFDDQEFFHLTESYLPRELRSTWSRRVDELKSPDEVQQTGVDAHIYKVDFGGNDIHLRKSNSAH